MKSKAFVIFAFALAASAVFPAQQSQSASSTNTQNSTPADPRKVAEMRGDILMARKQYDLAIESYNTILKNEPKNAEIMNKIGIAYEQLGDTNQAEHYYKKAMSADKKYAMPANNLGTLEYERQHYGKAIKLYERAIGLHADTGTIYANLGYAYYANKQYPKAMDAFGKAMALDPEIFERKGQGTGPLLQQRSAPDPGALYFLVAKSYAKAGDAEHAAHYLKLARDDGYKTFRSAEKDPDFAKVIKDPAVQEVLKTSPSYLVPANKAS